MTSIFAWIIAIMFVALTVATYRKKRLWIKLEILLLRISIPSLFLIVAISIITTNGLGTLPIIIIIICSNLLGWAINKDIFSKERVEKAQRAMVKFNEKDSLLKEMIEVGGYTALWRRLKKKFTHPYNDNP